ncbi:MULTISPECIES: Na(+)-translocating NADH-quinone reductase subunit C [unclassified Arenibacter]|uniref:Na(+)-translocating NADH-quinone reductase subunit C n=1 Tax=unclassified Arenibacter TaxID=2615047 RepID=UPI000E342D10|nr:MULTISPECIES: Na(+)-translocating NADH-quinone reductase subunit C [unclassified Arenibacter]MCM4164199.1 Na(+)-translocating NADH-quinone reductase subunit C [Arenibacter sp. A80]RFT55995.1 Na(+)-translocating NADH-quinone reductase subunit C [Arenibacter sp. P308M17]
MAVNTDKNSYTVIFAAVMVVIVGSLLAFFASSLSEKIQENERLEKQQNILYAMGVNDNVDEGSVNFVSTDKVADEFKKYIKEQLVIEGDKITKDDNAYLIDLKKQETEAKAGKTRKLPLFIGEKDGSKYYIIPMRGKGLWDAIWGFVALDNNLVVKGVYFDHKGETPGLGANIKQRYFMDDFTGESILNGTEYAGIEVAKGNNDPTNEIKDDNEVDALAGATITGNGLSTMIKESVKLYKSYLESIRAKN